MFNSKDFLLEKKYSLNEKTIIKLVSLILFFLFFSSCQLDRYKNLFNQWSDGSVTYLASITEEELTQEDTEDLLLLYKELKSAENCEAIQEYIETNPSLQKYENDHNLSIGFLFDEFQNYNSYSELFLTVNRSTKQNIIFSVLTIWKKQASLQEVTDVISKIVFCYPKDYITKS